MGEHKHNPNVKLAMEGKLPPRPLKKSKKQVERELYSTVLNFIFNKLCSPQIERSEVELNGK